MTEEETRGEEKYNDRHKDRDGETKLEHDETERIEEEKRYYRYVC